LFRETETGSAEAHPVRDNGTNDAVDYGPFAFVCLLGGEGVFIAALPFAMHTALLSCLTKPDRDFLRGFVFF